MKNLTLKDYEQFSAYLDGQLSPAEHRKLEEQLKSNPDWRLALDELSATRAILRRAPHYRAPRNFTITPELARQYARKSWLPSFVSFRLSSTVAALAVMAVMLLQLLPAGGLSTQVAMAPAADSQRNSSLAAPTQDVGKALEEAPLAAPQAGAPAAESSVAEATQPPVILWGATGSDQLLGRGGGGGGGDGNTTITSDGIVTYSQEKVGSPMYGGAADESGLNPASNGGIVNYGGEPSPNQATSANNYSPPYNLPPQSAETLPEQPALSQAPSVSAAELEGSGPILGVPSQDTAGQIIAVGPITASTEPDLSFAAEEAAQPAASFWTTTRIAQAGLLGLAVLAGVFALLARRRTS